MFLAEGTVDYLGQSGSVLTFDDIYPIGSIYTSFTARSEEDLPAAFRANGRRWIRLGAGVCLWSSSLDNSDLNKNIASGLPKPTITNNGAHHHLVRLCENAGTSATHAKGGNDSSGTDHRMNTGYSGRGTEADDGIHTHTVDTDAIYGSSDHVQPPALGVTFWKRVNPTQIVRVRFQDYNGDFIAETSVVIGDTINNPPATPDHSALGLTFHSWDKSLTIVEDNTVLTAVYSYKVTASVDTTSYGSISGGGTFYTNGARCILTVTPKEDTSTYMYTVGSWADDPSNTSLVREVPIGTASYQAKLVRYKLMYVDLYKNPSDLTIVDLEGAGKYRPGETYTIRAVSNNTDSQIYRFDHWLDDNDVVHSENPLSAVVPEKNTLTSFDYTAYFIRQFKVTFELNEGVFPEGVESSIIVDTGTVASTFKPVDPTLSGKTFGGWYRSANLRDEYEFDWTSKITAARTIYAKWI